MTLTVALIVAIGVFGLGLHDLGTWGWRWLAIDLMYAINHDLPRPLAEQIIAITLTTVTVSIVLHGISVPPLMDLYARRKTRRTRR